MLGASRFWSAMPVRITVRARMQATMDAAREDQYAGVIAACFPGVERSVERAARTLEQKTIRITLVLASGDFSRAFGGVDAAIVQDAPQADGDVEIGLAPGMDDKRQLASALPVENVDQPLPGVKLHGTFGCDPVGAARSARTLRAMRDVEDHGIGR